MTYQFEVIDVEWQHNKGDFIFARHVGDTNDLTIPDGSLFGGIPVYNYTEIRPLHDEQGIPRFDIFVFRLFLPERFAKIHFTEGQRVTLTLKETEKSPDELE